MKEDISLALKLYSVCIVLLYVIVSFIFIICVAPTIIAEACGWSLDNSVCQMIIALNNWFK
mgnify:FL=1